MLKGISKILARNFLAVLTRIGHGDEIVLADTNFPGERLNKNTEKRKI
jgi:L-fucose mutarotase